MAKNEKAAAPAEGEQPKSKKMLIIIVIAVLVVALVAVGALLFLKNKHAAEAEAEGADTHKAAEVEAPSLEVKFIPLETFTVNLQDSGQYLQLGLSLKILDPQLEEKIKATMPEIRSKILLLLSSKRAEELMTGEGKTTLAAQIMAETDSVLGIHTDPAPAAAPAGDGHTAPAAPAAPAKPKRKGVVDVLFTSFIIQ